MRRHHHPVSRLARAEADRLHRRAAPAGRALQHPGDVPQPAARGRASKSAFRRIRHFVSAGEKLPESLYEDWLELCGKPICDGIGASETVFLFLVNRPDDSCAGSSGKPVPWAEVRLVGEDGKDIATPETPD